MTLFGCRALKCQDGINQSFLNAIAVTLNDDWHDTLAEVLNLASLQQKAEGL